MVKETQKLGAYELPLTRLSPNCIDDLRKLFDATRGNDDFGSAEIAKAWDLKSPSSGGFYRRLNSMLLYGLIEPVAKGRFKISSSGTDILYPDPTNENLRRHLLTRSVLNVPLWKELYNKIKKNPPSSIFPQLKSITGAESPDIHEVESLVRKWYLDDMALVSDEFAQEQEHKSYMPLDTNNKIQSETPRVISNAQVKSSSQSGEEPIRHVTFGEMTFSLPVNYDLAESFEQFQEHMRIHLKYHEKVRKSTQSLHDSEQMVTMQLSPEG